MLKIVKVIAIAGDEFIPTRATEGDAGYDLRSTKEVLINPGHHVTIPVGFKIEIEQGHEAQIRSRSGLAHKNGVVVLNSPGTIDSGFRGEVKVILINHGEKDFFIRYGDRIAQMVFNKVECPELQIVDKLSETKRGNGGFGSSGK